METKQPEQTNQTRRGSRSDAGYLPSHRYLINKETDKILRWVVSCLNDGKHEGARQCIHSGLFRAFYAGRKCEADNMRDELSGSAASWQPIESAPKDGTEILLWRCGRIELAHWGEQYGYEWWANRANLLLSKGFWKYNSGVPDDWELPTHWMPMPQPPNEKAQALRAGTEQRKQKGLIE